MIGDGVGTIGAREVSADFADGITLVVGQKIVVEKIGRCDGLPEPFDCRRGIRRKVFGRPFAGVTSGAPFRENNFAALQNVRTGC